MCMCTCLVNLDFEVTCLTLKVISPGKCNLISILSETARGRAKLSKFLILVVVTVYTVDKITNCENSNLRKHINLRLVIW